jgi:hypothetical protein
MSSVLAYGLAFILHPQFFSLKIVSNISVLVLAIMCLAFISSTLDDIKTDHSQINTTNILQRAGSVWKYKCTL